MDWLIFAFVGVYLAGKFQSHSIWFLCGVGYCLMMASGSLQGARQAQYQPSYERFPVAPTSLEYRVK